MNKTQEGEIRVTRGGIGFLDIEGKESIRISNTNLNGAFNKDTVLVKNRKVIKILKRVRNKFVGTFNTEEKKFFVIPDDKRFYLDISISQKDTKEAEKDQKVLVKISDWGDKKKNPEGKVLEIIGKKGENEAEMRSILLERGVDLTFPKEVLKEAKEINRKIESGEIEKRKDIRRITTFTIDPVDAKDFDDALSIQKLENGNTEVGVHIADVSHYVRPGGELDKEAKERGFSVYLVDRTIPMLPEVLSNDVCSLNPDEDKLAFSVIFEFDKNYKKIKRWIGRTIIKSDKRFSYGEAQKVLDNKNGKFYEELDELNKMAKTMHQGRVKRGSILFDRDEVKIELDAKGRPVKIYKKKRLDTHKLIEEFMLLANREITEFVEQHSKKEDLAKVFVYRTHDLPDEEKMQELSIFLKSLGHELKVEGGVSPHDINRLLKKVAGEPEENLIKTSLIRAMAKAEYSTKNIGHFGLAFRFYTHFTSPIRRYPDLLVHRLLQKHLNKTKIPKSELVRYQKLSVEASQKEISAAEAERDSKKYKQVEYMSEYIGQEFEAVISGVTDWGLYVEEINTGSEGLVRLSDIGGDFYILDKKYSVKGQKTGKKFRLGDKVKVKLINADIENRTLDFVFI